MSDTEKYITEAEYHCVQDFAMHTEGEIQEYCKGILKDFCLKILKMENVDVSNFCIYEAAMSKCSNFLGNDGKYEESRKISRKLLKESLRNRRMGLLVICEYNELWIAQKILELEHSTMSKEQEIKSLNRCLLLSELANLSIWKNFFQQKLDV
jgi:hypothetical protein